MYKLQDEFIIISTRNQGSSSSSIADHDHSIPTNCRSVNLGSAVCALFYLTWSLTATSHTHMGSRRQVSSRVWARCLLLSSRLNSRLAQTRWNCRLNGSYIMRNQEELMRDSSLEHSPNRVLFLCTYYS